jgi:hypothetical protein
LLLADDKSVQGAELIGARDAVLATAGYYINCSPLAYETLLDKNACSAVVSL